MPIAFPEHPFFLASRLERRFPSRTARIIAQIVGVLALLCFIGYVAGGFRSLAGLGFVAAGTALAFAMYHRFIAFYFDRGFRALPSSASSLSNPAFESLWHEYIDFSSAILLAGAPDPTTPRNIIALFFDSAGGAFFFARTGVVRSDFLLQWDEARHYAGETSIPFASFPRAAGEHAIASGRRFITPADLFAAAAVVDPAFAQTLARYGIDRDDCDNIARWLVIEREHAPKGFLDRLTESPGIGKTWAYAFTPFLDRVSRPLRAASDEDSHILAHEKEITELEEALSRSDAANAIVVGDPGVGKMTVVSGLAKRVRTGRSQPFLNYRRVLLLAMEAILSEKTLGGVEASLGRLFSEAEGAGNVILVIEDIDNYLMPSLATHLSESLLPFLRSPRIKVIGLSTPEGYSRSAAEYPVLKTLFHEIRVGEPQPPAVIAILEDVALAAEKRSRKKMLFPTIKKIYELSRMYFPNVPLPERAVNLLDETFAFAASLPGHDITPDAVERVLERKVGANVGEVREAEKETLLDLEDILHRRVINQEHAITVLADALRRRRAGVAAAGKPAGSFLFLGPTGVGKTETAKALADAYFGSDERMIRLDMSEYQNIEDLGRLIGSRERHEAGNLATQIREHPFSLLLLDEIEKAHPNILNLFLQILDEGRLTDAYDKKVDFTNALIIATSNAGAEFIRESLSAGLPYPELQKRLVDEVLRRGTFRPEFVNRFDAVVVYTPLSEEHVRRVAALLLGELATRLKSQGYRLTWSNETLDWLARRGYSEAFGGRELRRLIQDTIEAAIARGILAGKYPKGSIISITPPPEAKP